PAAAPLPEDIGGLLKRQVPRLAGDAATLVQQDDYVAARLGGAQDVGHEVASPSSVVWNHEPVPPPPALQLDSTSVQPGGHMVLFAERGRHSVHIVARWGLGAGLEHWRVPPGSLIPCRSARGLPQPTGQEPRPTCPEGPS